MASSKTPAITDITPEKSEHIKGIALLLLMWHHLFGVNYIEKWLSPIEGVDMFIGVSAKVCLGIFLFCSGYGLYIIRKFHIRAVLRHKSERLILRKRKPACFLTDKTDTGLRVIFKFIIESRVFLADVAKEILAVLYDHLAEIVVP